MFKFFVVLSVILWMAECAPPKRQVETISDNWDKSPTHIEFHDWVLNPGSKGPVMTLRGHADPSSYKKTKYHILIIEEIDDSSSSDIDTSASESYEYYSDSESQSSEGSGDLRHRSTESKEVDTKDDSPETEGFIRLVIDVIKSPTTYYGTQNSETEVQKGKKYSPEEIDQMIEQFVEELEKEKNVKETNSVSKDASEGIDDASNSSEEDDEDQDETYNPSEDESEDQDESNSDTEENSEEPGDENNNSEEDEDSNTESDDGDDSNSESGNDDDSNNQSEDDNEDDNDSNSKSEDDNGEHDDSNSESENDSTKSTNENNNVDSTENEETDEESYREHTTAFWNKPDSMNMVVLL